MVTAGNFSNIQHCVEHGAIEGLRRLLNCTDSDTIVCVLDGYTRILECGERHGTTNYCDKVEECGALDDIELLQENQNDVSTYLLVLSHRDSLDLSMLLGCL